MNPSIQPTLGRIVHYICDPSIAGKLNTLGGKKYNVGDTVPGMVTRAFENSAVSLTLFPDTEDIVHVANIAFSSQGQPNTWNWPERAGESGQVAA